MDLDMLTYNRLLKDSFCLDMASTQEGRDYLEDCYRLEQTKPDLDSLRERFK